MLVGSCVKNDIRMILPDYLFNFISVFEIADYRDDIIGPLFLVIKKPKAQIVKLCLVDIKKDSSGS